MLGIILTGHGGFASGLEQAMKQILGEQPQFIAIDFPESSTTARLTAQLEQAVSELDGQHDIVFLTDLLGGTPFRVASTLAMKRPGSEVITGTNLQLLLEMVLESRAGWRITSYAWRAELSPPSSRSQLACMPGMPTSFARRISIPTFTVARVWT